jgi:arylsulfatase A-like enzyme
MKTNKFLLTGSLAALGSVGCSTLEKEVKAKPNIIFILIDDLGKEWINCYGGENIETPNIDKLAGTGMKFNHAYSMPQCTPSRACFMSGQYPYHNGWVNHWDSPRWGVGYYDWKRNPSIARVMKSAGYKTAVAGKWQLNDFRVHPDAMVKHGFDDYCMWTGYEGGNPPSGKRYWDPYIHTKEGSKTYKGKFGPDIYNQFVLDSISKHKDEPFFIYYPMALTHTPLVHTPHEMNAKTKLDKHKAMIRYTDFLLGKIVKHLDDLGIRENTIIVWTTDNGTVGIFENNLRGRSVRGGKTKTTENGVNAPFIVNCPGLVPKGVVSDALVDFTDMLPTFADFAGAEPDPKYKYDGVSLKDVFLGKKEESGRDYILAMGSHPAKLSEKGVENVFYFRDRVIRGPRYKLFIGSDRKPEKLVDLQKDLDEKNNLMDDPAYKDILEKLVKVIPTLPEKDNDPDYKKLKSNPWDKKPTVKSQIHKIGHPDNPAPNPPIKKKRKKRK